MATGGKLDWQYWRASPGGEDREELAAWPTVKLLGLEPELGVGPPQHHVIYDLGEHVKGSIL